MPRSLLLTIVLAALATLGGARVASAQYGQPAWTVGIQPTALAQPSPVSVTIYWCDKNFSFSASSRRILFKGQDVTSQFTYSYQGFGVYGCANYYSGTAVYSAVSQGTVTLTGTQTIDTLKASINNVNGTLLSATRTWQLVNYQVAVTPHGGVAAPLANQYPLTQAFQVRNYGNATATYTLSVDACTNGVSSCSAPSSIVVSPGIANQQTVNVTYRSGAADTKGTIQLKAAAGQSSDVGTVNLSVIPLSQPTTRVLASEINPGTSIDRASCLVFAIVPDVASECGALRITHPLPSVRTLNKVRTPTLVYYSDQLDTTSLAVHVILADTATIPDSVSLTLWNVTSGSGVLLAPVRTYAGTAWATNRAQRLTASGIASDSTGIVKYQVEVKLRYGTAWSSSILGNGELAIVNRVKSRFGAGWWLAGVERLFAGQWDGSVLWVAGDGSTRKYARSGTVGTDTAYLAEGLRRPDTLFRSAQGVYRRSLPNGTKVYFNSRGLDSATVNLLGHATRFVWSEPGGEPRLDSIVVPSGSSRRAYAFQYDAGGQLNVIVAPGDPVSQPRQVTLTRNPSGAGVARISGPDNNAVGFEFQSSAPDRLYLSRTDRRMTRTQFGMEGGSPATLAYASTPTGIGQQYVIDSLRTVRGIGASPGSAPVPVDSAYFRVNGPRADVMDVAKIWTDRFGAPTRIVNALDQTTTVRRDDWRFPGLVTRVESPVLAADGRQRVQTATFDLRGNLRTVADVNPYSDGSDAVTRYEYDDATWPTFPTRIVPPQGDSTVIEYNSDGTRSTMRDARGDSTRVFFYYGNSWKLLSSAWQRGIKLDSLAYGATLVNPAQFVTAAGDVTTIIQDSIGRDTLVVTPFDSTRTRFTRVRTVYDVVDQVDTLITTGDAIGTYPTKSVFVVNTQDQEGNVTSVSQWSNPDIPLTNGRTTTIGQIVTRWDYDLLQRKIREYAPDTTPSNLADNLFDETRYDPAGNVDRVITRRGDTLTMSYDALNRLTVRRVPRSMYASRSGIIQGTTFVVENPYGPERTTSYPRYPNDASNNPNGYTVVKDSSVFAYDELGNVTRADNRDALVRRGYYLNGLLRGDTLKIRTLADLGAGGDTTSHVYALAYKYDLNGRRAELTHPGQLAPSSGQNTTRYAYDVAGNLAAVTDPLGYIYQFQYNARGELSNRALANGAALSEIYTYDPDGNIASDIVSGAMSRNVTYSYYPGGKLKDARNGTGIKDTTWAAYTGLGHLGEGSLESHGAYNSAATQNSQNFGIDALGNVYETLTWSTYRDRNSTIANNGAEERGFERGTGRLSWSNPLDLTWSPPRVWKRDTTQYDAAGNVAFETTRPNSPPDQTGVEIHDRVFYYGADGKLRATDWRSCDFGRQWFQTAFDEYRYDALGRRVLLQTRRYCQGPVIGDCTLDWVRRTVWDGSSELYEIQMPLNYAENDVNPIDLPLEVGRFGNWDPNPFFGRVVYTHALGIDRPQSIIRMAYRTRLDTTRTVALTNLLDFAPIPIVPLWDARGQPDIGMFAHVGVADNCQTVSSRFYCSRIIWPGKYFSYDRPAGNPLYWHGSLIDDKKDPAGTLYRRNRYYDPKSGRFTQEDPIGLAGGLNAYGFAGGDPVNYSDPFGLCKDDDALCKDLVQQLRAVNGEEFQRAADRFAAYKAGYVRWVSATDVRLDPWGINSDPDPYSTTFGVVEHPKDASGTRHLGDVYLNGDLAHGDRMLGAVHEARHLAGIGHPDQQMYNVFLQHAYKAYLEMPRSWQDSAPLYKHRLCAEIKVLCP